MLKFKLVICGVLFFCSLANSHSQIPLHNTRNYLSNSSTKLDSAQRSITLEPNFSWVATNGKYYQTVITEGDLIVDWPKKNQVFQRQNNNQGWIYIKGSCTNLNIDSVRISAVVVQGGASKTKNVSVDAQGLFEGALLLNGGDYNIEISEFFSNGGLKSNPVKKIISRVGVGEVLLIWGHSFMEGDNISQAANDPRSRTVKNAFPTNPYFPNLSVLPFNFEKINTDLGPFNSTSWIFGALADTLVNRLNVPVLIYSSAFGGSRVIQNKQNINNEPFDEPWFANFEENDFPFRAVQAATQQYVPKTGLRGVLVHHGINDASFTSQLQSNYEFVINRIRNYEANHATLAFFLAFEHAGFPSVNDPIQNIVNNDPYIFPGVDLRDPATIGPWRDTGYGCNGCGHFVGTSGLNKYLELWKDVIPNSFFSTTTPKEAEISNSLKN
jgi:hypothetical protein